MKKITTLLLCLTAYFSYAQVPVFVHSVSEFRNLTEYNGLTYFITDGNVLWSTDGSTAGTQYITPVGTSNGTPSAYLQMAHNGKMYLNATATLADDGTDEALWISDGTENGTVLLKDGFKYITQNFLSVGDLLFFRAEDATHGVEWWVTDGTTAGTHITKDVNPGTPGQNVGPRYIAYHNKMYFIGYSETGEMDFWVSDGTEAGTYILAESDFPGAVPLNYEMKIYDDKLFFTFHERTNGIELWVTDGTAAGTHIVKNCNTGSDSAYPTSFEIIDNKLIFVAYNGNDLGSEYLWSTDGTEANTVALKKVTVLGGTQTKFVRYNGLLYFVGNLDNLGLEVCVTDGTATGTHAVKDVSAGTQSSFPERLVLANNKLFFFATNGTTGMEPWVSDGTEAGTTLLRDINPGTTGSMVGSYGISYAIGNKVYFVARIASNNQHLYSSDGTADGTVAVAPANATVTFSPLGNDNGTLYKMFGALYFEANFTSAGDSLYRLGTPVLSNEVTANEADFKVFPNPVTNILNIESAEAITRIDIYNTLGQVVISNDVNAVTAASVNMAALPAGYYIAHIHGNSGKTIKKILKN